MAALPPRREPAPVRHIARITDLTLAALTLVFFVAVALATGVLTPGRARSPSVCFSERSCWSDAGGR